MKKNGFHHYPFSSKPPGTIRFLSIIECWRRILQKCSFLVVVVVVKGQLSPLVRMGNFRIKPTLAVHLPRTDEDIHS